MIPSILGLWMYPNNFHCGGSKTKPFDSTKLYQNYNHDDYQNNILSLCKKSKNIRKLLRNWSIFFRITKFSGVTHLFVKQHGVASKPLVKINVSFVQC